MRLFLAHIIYLCRPELSLNIYLAIIRADLLIYVGWNYGILRLEQVHIQFLVGKVVLL